ncbi:CDP-diacylglycerol--glycerol-3-phosphate 3-phosphatidyltransferase [Cellvibrio japonicus]|uniref:CDP-diacylglycerol--glycerol-3-phosphate 3-phosphatidyltransferase n=1 Tax=Cellvibrio japonicus (strain Ueda107) TaxID=498211 RepID=B3PFS4_CELJU|nr:CDP-diacylglycerol--glycerol-3-phosphate 3-phosphatidyltransferase [Cellvibrio japonicus]ACE84252.1 CDP-diacylglycerol--glycerol-3-phosphate 3-phosphatidyltransferase [Cellvibrio japonicus Ueda107]QEI12297.1 CDP-diacylglycerol--glycerol-3-phosphate 3-phosphatidyltransferase [Cellvibrio japonicus]QEI15871.1 CDP-diacylglycerol--glycerol-3-phosphate 3-phosphatidyltransferase [Cellvibrio japonicus]QEI19449.1 CDP-diacylglycerol--glycerol-3-phosphate 3-phosphatidyltransferase [Cellvibrio japonicus
MTLANRLTLTRIVLIPLFVVVFFLPFWWAHFVSAIIFSVAAITDWADGYVARKYNQSTPFGAFLDPVADKLMVVIALLLLVSIHHHLVWFVVASAVIVGREIVISALREWMAAVGQRASVAVSHIGKLKTTLQMTALIVLLTDIKLLYPVGFIALGGAAVLTLWSMVLYLRAAWPHLLSEENQ